MVEIEPWLNNFSEKLRETFGNRLWFLGLQGSYGRGEATETSDIAVVVILDELSSTDIQSYNAMLDSLSHRELICGFLSGKGEILNWTPWDLFQFCYDTTPIKGSLDEVLSLVDESAVAGAIKTGLCNIFHGCVHNMLHEKNDDVLRGLYKSASFVVQAMVFQKTGTYIKNQSRLVASLSDEDKIIAETFLRLKNGASADFTPMSENLFRWTQKRIIGGDES